MEWSRVCILLSLIACEIPYGSRDCTQNAHGPSLGFGYAAGLRGIFMRLREMTKKDIPGGVRLNTVAGWNQTEVDWNRFLDGSALGCFVMEEGGKVVGT